MKKSSLIDMFGLNDDPGNNDQLDNLLFRLESEEHIPCKDGDGRSSSPFYISNKRKQSLRSSAINSIVTGFP
jgi:hypothetical protein